MKLLFENWRRYLKEAEGTTPRLIFLVGPPAVGKSYWVEQNLSGDYSLLNRDDIVHAIAAETGVGTYDDMYKRLPAAKLPEGKPGPEDPQEVEQYLAKLQPIADKHNKEHPDEVRQFGPVAPFSKEEYITALTPRTEWTGFKDKKGKKIMGWNVPIEYLVPLKYPKIKSANEMIQDRFEGSRSEFAKGKKDIVVDMVNMSRGERDNHRMQMASAIKNISIDKLDAAEAVKIINENFIQEAYVFAPDASGYSNEKLREKIKQVAALRAEVEKLDKGISKTIPPQAFDRFFGQYATPDASEGYRVIDYVGPDVAELERREVKLEQKLKKLRDKLQK